MYFKFSIYRLLNSTVLIFMLMLISNPSIEWFYAVISLIYIIILSIVVSFRNSCEDFVNNAKCILAFFGILYGVKEDMIKKLVRFRTVCYRTGSFLLFFGNAQILANTSGVDWIALACSRSMITLVSLALLTEIFIPYLLSGIHTEES